MKTIRNLAYVILFINFVSYSQVTTFIPDAGYDFWIEGDFMYYTDDDSIYRADISNPIVLAPPTIFIFDGEAEPGFDEGEAITSLSVSGDNLYFSVGQFLLSSRIHRLDLTDLASGPELVYTDYSNWLLDLDFYGSNLFMARLGYYDGFGGFNFLNTSGALPAASSVYLDKDATALTVNGASLYFAHSTYDGSYSDGEIYFKNLFLDLPEVLKFTAVGVINDLKFFEGLLYFTDDEGLKRINPSLPIPTSELLISDADYSDLNKIDIKGYVTGEKFLFASYYDVGWHVLKLDLNDPTLSIDEVEVNHFAVYPNPVDDWLHVISSYPIIDIKMYNMQGRDVGILYDERSTEDKIYINVNNLKSGIYMLQVTTSKGVEFKKICRR